MEKHSARAREASRPRLLTTGVTTFFTTGAAAAAELAAAAADAAAAAEVAAGGAGTVTTGVAVPAAAAAGRGGKHAWSCVSSLSESWGLRQSPSLTHSSHYHSISQHEGGGVLLPKHHE